MNVTIMFTWYDVTFPSRMSSRCSLTQAEVTFRSVLLARAIPACTASSKLFVDRALISETLATEPVAPPFALTAIGPLLVLKVSLQSPRKGRRRHGLAAF